jgi:hypothetical protein
MPPGGGPYRASWFNPARWGDRGRYVLRPWFETWVGLADEKCRHAESAPTRLNAGSRRRGRRVGISALPVDVPRRVHRGVRTANWGSQAATASARLHGWSVTPEEDMARSSGPAGELVDEINATGEDR